MKDANLFSLKSVAILAVILVMVTACGSSTPNRNSTTLSSANARIVACPLTSAVTATIAGFTFLPAGITVAANGIVQWTNNDPTAHTVTSGIPGSPDGTFDSGNIAQNGTVCIQFIAVGTYRYFCNIHPSMTGMVTVQ